MPERRLIDEGASALEREVLAAWEDEKAPRATRVRATRLAVEAAGVAVVVAGTAHGAAGLGAKGLGWSFSWLAKGLAMALFVGASATVVASVVSGVNPLAAVDATTITPPPAPPARIVRRSGATVVTAVASVHAAAEPMVPLAPPKSSTAVANTARPAPKRAESRAERASAPASSGAPVSSSASSAPHVAVAPRFTDEVRMLGDVRSALAAHDPARGLVVLDTFATLYPTSELTAEAEVLRIDAVLARGDRALAGELATTFLAARPKSPYRQHVEGVRERSLTGATR